MSRRVPGRGLEALIPKGPAPLEAPEGQEPDATTGIRHLPIDRIVPNPRQPRETFDSSRLEELAKSIREKGIIEPLIVRPTLDGRYEIVAGERRFRAAQLIGNKEVPVIVREYQDRETLEVALIENLQREDLNPVEEARAYLRLTEEFGRTHAEISQEVGKDRSTISNLLRLLRLPNSILEDVSRGTLSVGHARVLVGVEDVGKQEALARRMMAEGWSVRQAEKHIARILRTDKAPKERPEGPPRDRSVIRVEEALRYALGTEVHLNHTAKGGSIEIRYESQEELERILEHLGVQIP